MRRNIETESVSRAGNEDHPIFMPAEVITLGWLLNVGPTGKKVAHAYWAGNGVVTDADVIRGAPIFIGKDLCFLKAGRRICDKS